MEKKLDLYTDFLMLCTKQATATDFSKLLENKMSHDTITDLLNNKEKGSKELWKIVKPLVRQEETENACLVFDDTLLEKPHSEENAIVNFHYDHTTGTMKKGINILSCLYQSHKPLEINSLKLPIAFEIIKKDQLHIDPKTGKDQWKSAKTKNELMIEMFEMAIKNQVKFKYVLADSWYNSSNNMEIIHKKGKFFVFALKSNRLVSVEKQAWKTTKWQKISEMEIPENKPISLYLKDLSIKVLVYKQVFRNGNEITGTNYLVTNQQDMSAELAHELYHKRWSIEEQHKSLKQNCALAKSPAHKVRTQSNHIFASFVAYFKFEHFKFAQTLNHFALKSKLYIYSIRAAFQQLVSLKSSFPLSQA
jgi:DDE superfamily endonuclease